MYISERLREPQLRIVSAVVDFLGTDTAPHERASKESACGCAGIFNAPFALESYAQVFDEEGALAHLEAFASRNGPAFLQPASKHASHHIATS